MKGEELEEAFHTYMLVIKHLKIITSDPLVVSKS